MVAPVIALEDGFKRRLLTVDEYHLLYESGHLDDERAELICGEIIVPPPIGPEHADITTRLTDTLRRAFGEGFLVRVQAPLTAPDSEPQPDIAIVRGAFGQFRLNHPTTAELVVEVASTSLRLDRSLKATIYASMGVPEYWVVNLVDSRLEVMTDPDTRDGESLYKSIRLYRRGEALTANGTAIGVDDIL